MKNYFNFGFFQLEDNVDIELNRLMILYYEYYFIEDNGKI